MVGGREVQLQRVVLTGAKESYQGDGTVDFARTHAAEFSADNRCAGCRESDHAARGGCGMIAP